ncbi:uncharacterized protein LOC122056280 isoform X2 [Zingiber officinale]|uniref:uncharacterized protein LOC122056280 isoform X2 n=1 Tax=Zingiber officinale TaxID=94328 RepID=UPI001C4BA56E|nr:uncharacterized protein LOC122056280 isoform X2 [Zingiber officinale]
MEEREDVRKEDEFADTISSYGRRIILQNYQERVTCSEIKNSFSEMNFYSDDELEWVQSCVHKINYSRPWKGATVLQ